MLTGDEARRVEPALSGEIGAAILLRGQRFINPGVFVHALADSVRDRGGKIRAGADVTDVRDEPGGVAVRTGGSDFETFDAVVLASGVWLGGLARRFGVGALVQAGRGYSFSVPMERVPDGPVYFPAQRVACTPLGDRLRVAGMMEFRRPEAPLDPRRIRAIVEAARPLLRGADLDARRDEWVGSRPCTRDGLPLIGATRSPRVFAAGGHGMWGITLGPATGSLLAEMIAIGRRPGELDPFDPLR
ncbi:NAD(P)/FAD-dependent oxidoreductase [Actinomadura luteofluorescens]|uniref:NAD(P)/FAD-dependent oxidoreductase n=1 Tax=Actinomadura luteofluorescens TaxID=46163 RepID=UPI003632CA33